MIFVYSRFRAFVQHKIDPERKCVNLKADGGLCPVGAHWDK